MNSQEFIQRLRIVGDSAHKDNPGSDSRYAFFLGAGCSVSSGIPAAGALVRESWIPRLCRIQRPNATDYVAFARERFPGYEPEQASSFYGQLIDALFVTPNERQREIEQLCEGKFPGFGYAALAKLVAHRSTAFNVVLTTNFDDLMADALYLYTEARPLVIHHESLAAFIRPTRLRPLVVKLHGDSRLSPRNTREETEQLGENLRQHIAMLLNDRGLIFMGYGGADSSILQLLAELPEEALPSGVFWLSPSEPSGKVYEWLTKRAGVWVKITDFDEFMLRAYAAFEMKHPSKAEFDKMFGQYYETYGQMATKVRKPADGSAPDPALLERLESASAVLPDDYKEIARGEALAATQPAEAQQVLTEIVKKSGSSLQVQVQAALTLRDTLRKYGEAVSAFESALQMAITDSGERGKRAAIVRAELAWTRLMVGDLARAAKEIDESIDWAVSQAPADEALLSNWLSVRARIRKGRGDLKGAEEDIERSITWGEAQTPRDERELAFYYSWRANIRQSRGDLDGAEEDIERSIAWGEAQTPRDERELAIFCFLRARIRQDRGDLKGAEEDIELSIASGEAQTPRDERELAIDYSSRARIRQDRGDLKGAWEDIARGIAWFEAQTPHYEHELAVAQSFRASIRQDRGDLRGAEEDVTTSISWFRANQPDNRCRMAMNFLIQARILSAKGHWDRAKASIDESVANHESVFGKDHDWTQRARTWQAKINAREVPPRWIDTVP